MGGLKGKENMLESRLKYFAALVAFSGLCAIECFGQTMSVKIIKRQSSETSYSYVVPGHLDSTSDTKLNCDTESTDVRCSGTTTTDGTITSPREISYQVTGATFSLLLPNGRVVVVNCESKFKYQYGGSVRRSCRTPLVDDIQVEFKGKDAKLMWPASVDGKNLESETYKILAVLDK
jgi:hypothetical protein